MKLVGQETSIYVIIGCRSPAAEEIERAGSALYRWFTGS